MPALQHNIASDHNTATEARSRIDSLNSQPQARPSSYIDETTSVGHEINRTCSFGGARPASIIEEVDLQDGVIKLVTIHSQ